MDIILYITGGIALLALAWLFIQLATTVKSARLVLEEAGKDLNMLTETISEVKTQIVPILGDVNSITTKLNNVATGVETQMLRVHETIDDSLDVIRGTIDDLERLKDDVISTVEGPITLIKASTDGAVGALLKGYALLRKLFGDKKPKPSKNGKRHEEKDIPIKEAGSTD